MAFSSMPYSAQSVGQVIERDMLSAPPLQAARAPA
jgi:hypothetical protein